MNDDMFIDYIDLYIYNIVLFFVGVWEKKDVVRICNCIFDSNVFKNLIIVYWYLI